MANLKLMELARQIQSGIRHPICGCELPCSPKTVEDGQKEAKRKETEKAILNKVLGERNLTDRYGL